MRVMLPMAAMAALSPAQNEFVSELPKTATGTIQRFKLREREIGRK
jgi:acyl-coenzyme A synthetase/AMP-(fatty) acid ligase